MSDAPAVPLERLLESLRDRERALQLDAACLNARLDEVRDTIASLTSRVRSRPRPRAVEPASPQPELPEAANEPQPATEPPPEAA